MLFAMALWISWGFGYETVWARFATELNGVVISSRDAPSTGAPRYGSEYVVRDSDGHDHRYIAGPADGSLERSLPVGTNIRKDWGHLDYEIDGKHVSFPSYFYSATFGVALFCLLFGIIRWRSDVEKRGLS
jgi:hypothetical protein